MDYVIKEKAELVDLVAIFTKPAVIMVSIGALGHQLNIPYLFKFGYWQVFLLLIVTGMFRGRGVSKYKIVKEKD